MKKNLRRMLIALVISSAGFLGTVIWFKSGKSDGGNRSRHPMARLDSASNEVQRKPLKRVIWENIAKNDELYAGEAIRTAPNAEAQLYFEKTKTTVHLDPDSLVVLEETDKGLSLDFLQGNLFVQSAQAEGTAGLTLKTGNGEITLKSADLSLSKNQNGNVDLEIHRGEAQLNQGSKTTALNRDKSAQLSGGGVSLGNDRMQLLHPSAGETLFLNLTRGEKLGLMWKALPPGYEVRAEVGATRSSLQRVSAGPGETGELAVNAKPGRYYARLVATNKDSTLPPLTSSIVPFTIQPKSAPALVEPRSEAAILHTEPNQNTEFHWLNRNRFTAQILEVASDPLFKNHKLQQNLDSDAVSFSSPLADGTYFWRVTGFLKLGDKTESLASSAGKFVLNSKWELKPPIVISPANQDHLAFVDAQKNGVVLKWQTPPGVEKVKVMLERMTGEVWQGVQSDEFETTSTHIPGLQPGIYRWHPESLDAKGGPSKAAPVAQFTIEDMPKIEWVSAETPVDYQFATPTPSLVAHWKPLAVAPFTYRFRVHPEGAASEAGEWHNTKQTVLDLPVASEGAYQIVIEALNAKEQLVGQSDPKMINVKRQPLLPAPQWSATTPDLLKADARGNLTFGWEHVEGAQHYLMILENPDGTVVQQKEITRTTASLTKLKPGEYQVHVQSVDANQRGGLAGDKRKLQVPMTSDIRAPKIKAMKVN